jgi:cystathionine beta-lyase
MDAVTFGKCMLTEARLWFEDGQKFGEEGRGYMRANLGCLRSTLDEAIERLSAAIRAL